MPRGIVLLLCCALFTAGLVLGGIATATLGHLQKERSRPRLDAARVKVLAVKSDLPAGATLSMDDLTIRAISTANASSRNIPLDRAQEAIGKKLRHSLAQADFLLTTDIEPQAQTAEQPNAR